ncbi:hypothetical protein GCM10023191_003670 [Actinoallomurus oryzae]|uniref:Uncharacterized protein n=1 Tax=Actinoallomurus oryzae TaxID=502180 RepID=A0ABP8PA29_9ACTN
MADLRLRLGDFPQAVSRPGAAPYAAPERHRAAAEHAETRRAEVTAFRGRGNAATPAGSTNAAPTDDADQGAAPLSGLLGCHL